MRNYFNKEKCISIIWGLKNHLLTLDNYLLSCGGGDGRVGGCDSGGGGGRVDGGGGDGRVGGCGSDCNSSGGGRVSGGSSGGSGSGCGWL